jgi:hypothetical protein
MNIERLEKQVAKWQKDAVMELLDSRPEFSTDQEPEALWENPVFRYEVLTKVGFFCAQRYGINSKETKLITKWVLKNADPELLAETFRNSASKVWKWGHFDLSRQLQGMANDLNGGN